MSFNPGGAGGISAASDVALNNPATDQSLAYNATTQKWINRSLAATASDTLGSFDVTVGTPPPAPANDGKYHIWLNTAASTPTYPSGLYVYDTAVNTWVQNGQVTTNPDPDVTLLAPANVVATALDGPKISLTWNAVSGAEAYEVWEENTTAGPVATVTGTTRTSGNLAYGTYTYRVRAIAGTSQGTFGYANELVLSTSGPTAPPPAPGTLMTLAQLQDPNNFGIPAGTTLTTVAWTNTHAQANNQTYNNINFTNTGMWTYTYGTGNTYINCRWNGQAIVARGNGHTFTRCEAGKFSTSSGSNNVYTNIKAIPTPGLDGFGVTSDAGSQCTNILLDGYYAVGNMSTLIGSSGNHYDSIQIRGVAGLTMRNLHLDQGTSFSSTFNATIFLENANGGNSNVLIENFYSRAAGYHHFYLFATNCEIRGGILARQPDANTLYAASTAFTESDNEWDDGAPIASLRT